MDKYRIDSHKLLYHVSRVKDWLDGKLIYPIYAEIAATGQCNQRCTFCALDYMGYENKSQDKDILLERLSEMGKGGLKSVMYAGEGEPLIHKQIGGIIVGTKKCGIDVALTTNGVNLHKTLTEQILGSITWIKTSINAGTKERYAKIHSASPSTFERVLKNLSYAVEVRKREGYSCTLGAQAILLEENADTLTILAKRVKDIGLDYLVIKPFSQHPMSNSRIYENLRYGSYYRLQDEVKKYENENFKVIFRAYTMKKLDENGRYYDRCQALPFWVYIDAGGNVWGCSAYLGDERFLYGNIYENTFGEIWTGGRRKKSLDMVATSLDATSCRQNCRLDEINRYLWDLKNPSEHVNFI
ncbi:MAG: radical SAM protein [Candidatus Brocadiales bacterium]|nr:radical SAM protein [Candidatus Brocadiales bacterium]